MISPRPAPGADGTHFATCPLCEAMCGIAVDLKGGSITRIRGDDDDHFSRGHMCPKATALKELHEDPDRLRQPLVRAGNDFRTASWDEAIAAAAAGLVAVQREHGNDAVAAYLGNPTVHNLGAMLFAPNFVRSLGSKHRFSATSVDQLPHQFVSYFMFGHQLLLPVPDIDHTDFWLVLGANPLVSNGSLMTAPDVKRRIKTIQGRGGQVVVIDPRRSETARVADAHHFIRPGTDAVLLLAMIHVIERENLAPPSPALALSDGRDRLRDAAQPFTPERAAAVTGVDVTTIINLARRLATSERAVVYGRMGLSTQPFGALCQWLINALNILTGHFDRHGGALFTRPALDAVGVPPPLGFSPGSYGRWSSRVRGAKEFGGELPVAVLAEEILTPGPGGVRALVTIAGNPALSTPNGAQLDTALAALDYYVAIDPYLNESTRHAHVILPPVGPLEREQYDIPFHLLAVRNTAKFSPPVFPAPPAGRHDWQIILALEEAMLAARRGRIPLAARARFAALRRLGPSGLVDLGLRTGPYGLRRGLARGLSVKRLRDEHHHGVDLGPLAPSLPGRLPRGRRIDLAPPLLLGDVARLDATYPAASAAPVGRDADGTGGWLLIGRRQLRGCNSWLHNAPGMVSGKPRCTVQIHPDDAQRLGIVAGSPVRIRSRVGSVTVPAEITDDLMPGVISLPHGFGHGRPGVRLDVAAQHAGVSVNDITDENHLDLLSGNAALNGVPVTVEAAEA